MKLNFKRDFLSKPICHRGLHDASKGRTENSWEAVEAAMQAGLPVEVDIQNTKDGKAVVFHDHKLNRLTELKGSVHELSLEDIVQTPLKTGGTTISFANLLERVAGKIPILVELKDQDGALGTNLGSFLPDILTASQNYRGALAFMSFNPYLIEALQKAKTTFPTGLVSDAFNVLSWPKVPSSRRKKLRKHEEIAGMKFDFISHDWEDLERVRDLEHPKLCWTVKSPQDEKIARKIADNITFEGYEPEIL